MYVRVVRFTDIDPDRIEGVFSRIRESGGPPPGVSAAALTFLHDEAQRTAVVLQHYNTLEDMEASAKVLDAMDPGETPGTRVSVDLCEVKLELTAAGS